MSQVSIVRTHNAYHLGDNLIHLNFLRRVARENRGRQFVHYAQWQHLAQLRDMIQDVRNIRLEEFTHHLPADSINAWRGTRQFWYDHPDRLDFVKFHTEAWFPHLSDRMDVENPVRTPFEMLFNYPAIAHLDPQLSNPFDILVINSAPGSGQFQGYDEFLLGNLAIDLANKGHHVITTAPVAAGVSHAIPCTADRQLTVTQIGHLSLHCHTIVMISTGPSWPTFNVWNREKIKNRIILLNSERVNLAPNTVHCETVTEASEELKKAGLL